MSDTSSVVNEPKSPELKPGAQSSSNADRLEKKKNREKRRRSEVNDRFDELIEVMEDAQSQLMNAPAFPSEFSKGVLTKAGLLEKAVDLVKLLAEENKKLKMMIQQPASQAVPMMAPPFDPSHAQNWMAAPPLSMPGYSAPVMQPAPGIGKMIDCPPFMPQPQNMMFAQPLNNMGYPPAKPSVLSYSDLLQLGDWNGAPVQFQHGSGMKPVNQKVLGYECDPGLSNTGPAPISTHAECA